MALSIYNGDTPVEFELPTGWQLLDSKPVSDDVSTGEPVAELTRKGLAAPLGAPPLGKSLKPGGRVTIITDDGARNTPVRDILPVLFDELAAAGVGGDAIDILIGLGTHSEMSRDALIAKFGIDIVDGIRITQHDCHAPDLTPITTLASGTEVKVNPLMQAGTVIGVGTILPHPMNGFGGGPKIVFPAVANYEAIREHHLAFTAQAGSVFGNVEDNPFYGELSRIVGRSNLTHSLDCLYDRHDTPARVLFGSWQAVHEEGGRLSRHLTGINFSRKSQVTLVAGYPYQEALQLMKPMGVAGLVTELGGTLILTAKSRTDYPPFFFEVMNRVKRESDGRLKKYAIDSFNSGTLLLENAPVDLNCALFYALVCSNDFRCVLVSRDLNAPALEEIGFTVYPDLETALAKESGRTPRAEVNLVPLGGALPVLPQGLANNY